MAQQKQAVVSKRSHCRICTNQCGIVVDIADDQIVRVKGDFANPISNGYTCPKGRAVGRLHHHPDAIARPMVRKDGELVTADWDECLDDLAARLRAVINDPTVEVRWARDRYRPAGASRLDTELFAAIEKEIKARYGVDVLPEMSTGASDKAQMRSKGVQCYGIGPAVDYEDGARGYGAHSDQERILVDELHRFVRFQYDVVMDVARAK